jgi:hypothetical protein
MPAALALVLAAALSSLPPLPQRGLALETQAGVQLQTMAGRPLATLAGMDLAFDQAVAHKLVVRDRQGRMFVLSGRRLRSAALGRGCRTTDVALVVCARTIRSGGRIVARAPRVAGHWVWAARAPLGAAVLAQWSGECETPTAYLVTARGRLRSYGAETVALGWLPGSRALIHFRTSGCAGWSAVPGIYAVPTRRGEPRLVLRTPRLAQYLMWGG